MDSANRTGDGVAATLGVVVAALTLVGAASPLVAGTLPRGEPAAFVVVVNVVLTVVVIGAFLARRFERLPRRTAAPIAGVGGLVIVLSSTYGLNQGVIHTIDVPLVGATPALLLAVVGGGLAIAAAAADFAGISGDGIYRRTVATIAFSAVGAVSFVFIMVWFVILDLVAVLSTGASIQAFSPPNQIVLSQLVTVLGVGSIAVGFLAMTDREWSFIDLRMPTRRDLGYVAGGFVALLGAAILLNVLVASTGTESAGHSTFEQAEANPEILLVLVPASIFVIGPFEELLYRNVIQKSLYAYFSRAGAVVVASVPFAIVHFSAYWGGHVGQSLVSLGVVLSLSLILGALYARTDNLLVPAFVHGLYNAVLFASAYVAMTA